MRLQNSKTYFIIFFVIILLSFGCSGGGSSGDSGDNTGGGDPPPVNEPPSNEPPQTNEPPVENEPNWEILSLPAGATIEVYSLADLAGSPIYTTQSTNGPSLMDAGQIDIPDTVIVDGEYYLLIASDGLELDADNDNQPDPAPLEINGQLHALLTAEQIKSGSFFISILTEIVYQRIYYLLAANYDKPEINVEINRRAGILLKEDLNSDGSIDWDDVTIWKPRQNQSALRHNIADYESLTGLIIENQNWAEKAFAMSESVISQLPVRGWDIVIQGQTAFIADTYGFIAYDISEPNNVMELGQGAYVEIGRGITVDDSFAYVSLDTINGGDKGLVIFDISDPQHPTEVGSLGGSRAGAIVKHGSIIYLVDSGVRIVDVSDPANPVLINTFATDVMRFDKILIVDQILYGFTHFSVEVYNLDNPQLPVHINSISITFANDFDIGNGYLYTTAGEVVPLTDPATAQADPNLKINIANAYAVDAASNQLLFAVADGIDIFDITDVSNPIKTGQSQVLTSGFQIARFGQYAILIGGDAFSQVIDLQAAPVESDPAVVGSAISVGAPTALDMVGSLVYMTSENDFMIYDVTDPVSPQRLSSVSAQGRPHGIKMRDNYALLANGMPGLTVFDVTNPSQPEFVVSAATPQNAWGVELLDNYAYVSSLSAGLQIFDISNASSPIIAGSVDTTGDTLNSAVTADYVYMINSGVQILQLENPTTLTPVSNVLTRAFDVAYQDNYIYIASGRSGFAIYNVTDPSEIAFAANGSTPGLVYATTVLNSYLYLSDGGGGLRIYDVAERSNPVLRGRFISSANLEDVYVTSSYIYAAGGVGLMIYRTPYIVVP